MQIWRVPVKRHFQGVPIKKITLYEHFLFQKLFKEILYLPKYPCAAIFVHRSISDKIRYLTMTDTKKVWMPDTFFR